MCSRGKGCVRCKGSTGVREGSGRKGSRVDVQYGVVPVIGVREG